MYDFWLYRWLAERFAGMFASRLVESEHIEPDESDWSWESDLAETITEMHRDEVSPFFTVLTKLFDRGFGPQQIGIIENLVAKLRPAEARQLDFHPARKGKSVTLQILLVRSGIEEISVGVRSTPAMIQAIEALLGQDAAKDVEA